MKTFFTIIATLIALLVLVILATQAHAEPYDTKGMDALVADIERVELVREHSINKDGSYKYPRYENARPIDGNQPVIELAGYVTIPRKISGDF